jgi:hypothetical protein
MVRMLPLPWLLLLLQAIKRMAAANRVNLPPNVRLRQHDSHLLAAAAATAFGNAGNTSPGSTLQAVVLSSTAANGSSKDVDAMEAAAGSTARSDSCLSVPAQERPLMQHVRSAMRTTGGCSGLACSGASACLLQFSCR